MDKKHCKDKEEKSILNKHSLIMLLCCLIPIVLVAILYFAGIKNYALYLILFACPVLHIIMMKYMHGDNKEHKEEVKQ